MIDISGFTSFLIETFNAEAIFVDEFKPNLQFIEVDCFSNQPIKLATEISSEAIKVSTISKTPSIDFPLYDYFFDNIAEAKNFVLGIKTSGIFPNKKATDVDINFIKHETTESR